MHGRHSANREIGRLIYIEYAAISAVGLLIGLVIRLLRVKLNLMLNSVKYTDFWHIMRTTSKKEKCLTK